MAIMINTNRYLLSGVGNVCTLTNKATGESKGFKRPATEIDGEIYLASLEKPYTTFNQIIKRKYKI